MGKEEEEEEDERTTGPTSFWLENLFDAEVGFRGDCWFNRLPRLPCPWS
jgi:hypothetical protein